MNVSRMRCYLRSRLMRTCRDSCLACPNMPDIERRHCLAERRRYFAVCPSKRPELNVVRNAAAEYLYGAVGCLQRRLNVNEPSRPSGCAGGGPLRLRKVLLPCFLHCISSRAFRSIDLSLPNLYSFLDFFKYPLASSESFLSMRRAYDY